ncbi:MAG: hypothetical protein IBX41_03115 [Methanophagales archaeon]|nr:hypothetical protein [Methanophagales archaeon]
MGFKRMAGPGCILRLIIIALMVILLVPHGQALQMLSGDQVSVDSPIDDDVFAAGGTVSINAPIAGAVLAGGDISINAPVSGDVFVAGGQIVVNSDIDGKIVAAGGTIELRGGAKNVVIAGGNVNIHPDTVISRDAVIAGDRVSNAGTIIGNLTVRAEEFHNTGSAGSVDFKKSEGLQGLQKLMNLFSILMTVGFLIIGLIVLKLFPAQFFIIEEEVRKSPVKNTVVGFVLILASVILILVLAVTLVGFPVALLMGMLFIIALMLSSLFVSFAVGRTIVDVFKIKTKDILIFVLGFIILSLLFRIPYAGWVIRIVAISLGFGALVYAVYKNWQSITTSSV